MPKTLKQHSDTPLHVDALNGRKPYLPPSNKNACFEARVCQVSNCHIYNESLAGDIERSERLLMETGDGQDESPLTIDLAGLVETVQGSAREQGAYLVDMAKADALDLLGETRQAFELVERHV